jgi:hypothetical protein
MLDQIDDAGSGPLRVAAGIDTCLLLLLLPLPPLPRARCRPVQAS